MINIDAFLALQDPFDRLISELEIEFGSGDCAGLAQRYLDAEEADFAWQARIAERHLGRYIGIDDEQFSLQRVAIIGLLNARWFAAACLVDDEGAVQELLWLRQCNSQKEAHDVFQSAR